VSQGDPGGPHQSGVGGDPPPAMLRRTGDVRSGSIRDVTACPRRRQLSPKAAMAAPFPGSRRIALPAPHPWPDHVPVPSFGPRMVCILLDDPTTKREKTVRLFRESMSNLIAAEQFSRPLTGKVDALSVPRPYFSPYGRRTVV
jgi:hypothetical protein